MSDKKFKPLSVTELAEILGLTIKKDFENKVITFFGMLVAYTDNAQFNLSFNAPSSTGKSYIPLEISKLFPSEDLIILANCSPTAFFHEQGQYDKDTNTVVVDLSRKIIIFLDQPSALLLERLRSLLSHDEKEMRSKTTDKGEKGGHRTKTVVIKGFATVVFCSAGLRIDEQEATRFFLLSPEINQEKIRQAIEQRINKEADGNKFNKWLDKDPERQLLKDRILAIKAETITEVEISNPESITAWFLAKNSVLKPRHQRDVAKLLSLIKAHALLNLWWRERKGDVIVANDEDAEAAIEIWEKICVSQDLNLSPYVYSLYQDVILPAWKDRLKELGVETTEEHGLSRKDISQKHYDVHGRVVDSNQLRHEILPILETAGLIYQERSKDDKRKFLIYPIMPKDKSKNNSVGEGGAASGEIIIDRDDMPF